MPRTPCVAKKLMFIAACLSLLALVSLALPPWSVAPVAAGFTPTPEPPPAPTEPPPAPAPNPKPDTPCLAEIRGVVTDICNGQPGQGIQVGINGSIVTTDSQGSYSLSGVEPGTYVITVGVSDPPGPVTVYVECDKPAIADIGYNPCPAAATPAPAVVLPETGGVSADAPTLPIVAVVVAGCALAASGWLVHRRTRV
jgi:pectin methylesterase-like acyl-CoA thioesterase